MSLFINFIILYECKDYLLGIRYALYNDVTISFKLRSSGFYSWNLIKFLFLTAKATLLLQPPKFKFALTFVKNSSFICFILNFKIMDNSSNPHRCRRKIQAISFQTKWKEHYLERNNMTLTSLLEAWMAQLGQQHGLYVPHDFHFDGEVLSDVSAPEWRYCPLPQQEPRMELPEII